MTIQLELNPELEAQLAAQAAAQGIPVEKYAHRLLQNAVEALPPKRPRPTQEEFEAALDALGSNPPNAPHLATETFSREMIYGDHP